MVRQSVRSTPCTLTWHSLYFSHALRLSRIRELSTQGTATLKPSAAEYRDVGVAAVITTFVRTKQKMLRTACKLRTDARFYGEHSHETAQNRVSDE